MRRILLLLLGATLLVSVVLASATSLSLTGGTLQAYTFPEQTMLPPSARA